MKKKAIVAGHICLDITPTFMGQEPGGISGMLVPGRLIQTGEADVHTGGVENNRQTIISPPVFEEAQHQMVARHSGKNRASCTGVFSSRIKCGDWYGSKVPIRYLREIRRILKIRCRWSVTLQALTMWIS